MRHARGLFYTNILGGGIFLIKNCIFATVFIIFKKSKRNQKKIKKKSKKMNQLVEIRNSAIAGVGGFALQEINAGELVHTMKGEYCDAETMMAKIEQDEVANSDAFQIGDHDFLHLDEESRSLNHACNPNVYVRGTVELVATRKIAVGEEITFDYSTTMLYDKAFFEGYELEEWTCPCACGAENCRGIIDEFRNIPKEKQAIYIQNKWLPDFMLKHFKA
ncbi:MAG: hypothetical protein RL757_2706 [Bacteroidota bacterium]